jgi:N-acetylmuramate 1-kinase
MSDLLHRLKEFLASHGQPTELHVLTADASTREYFRIVWNGETAVACVYSEPFEEAVRAYVDVTELFLANGLPVARLLYAEPSIGIVVQEDLGDTVVRTVIETADEQKAARLLNEAITLIARVQLATDDAFRRGSIASKLRFDVEKLQWELDFFKQHYFQTFRQRPLSSEDDRVLSAEFTELVTELDSMASVLCHRDLHAANLMIDRAGHMRIIDHQDARIGSPAYDLVSLLLDRITYLPSREWLSEKRAYFLDVRVRFGLPRIDEEEFAYEFRLQTIQRCLKAAGTFSYQAVNRGKTHFIPFIKPMFGISRRGAESLGRFPMIQTILERELLAD